MGTTGIFDMLPVIRKDVLDLFSSVSENDDGRFAMVDPQTNLLFHVFFLFMSKWFSRLVSALRPRRFLGVLGGFTAQNTLFSSSII